ncbi:hypothetical protein ANN_09300 [Periplaneta americana]|uniref:DUF4817 domain-containing protein n=1 Tax=Periplaneta americana TaxID=6978 RepID=A0ABQ8TL04_PERAM|nr:hypothetical protein ANN_09300 [Periplaneta americana]
MPGPRLMFEQRKCIQKWFMRFYDAVEVQRQWRREYETEAPTRMTIKRIIGKFEAHGTTCAIHKGRSGRSRTATSPASSARVGKATARRCVMCLAANGEHFEHLK